MATAVGHRVAAIRLRSHARTVDGTPVFGADIWPALAAEHDRRAARMELTLARTAEIDAIVDNIEEGR